MLYYRTSCNYNTDPPPPKKKKKKALVSNQAASLCGFRSRVPGSRIASETPESPGLMQGAFVIKIGLWAQGFF